jgi:hypothetical protein
MKEIVDILRKTAESLRKEDPEIKKRKAVKCAQVLTAARGLQQFKAMLQEASDDNSSN